MNADELEEKAKVKIRLRVWVGLKGFVLFPEPHLHLSETLK
jgi:hypothetical protein